MVHQPQKIREKYETKRNLKQQKSQKIKRV